MFRLRFALAVAILVFPYLVFADGFSDYRIPKHQVYVGSLSFSGYARNAFQSYKSERLRNSREYGTLSTTGKWIHDSDPLRLSLTFSGQAYGSLEDWRQTDAMGDSAHYKLHSSWQDLAEQWIISGDTRLYPWTFPVGLTASFRADGGYGQGWSTQYAKETYNASLSADRQDHEAFIFEYNVSGSVGAGIGRVRDASPVYEIFVLEKRLRDLGVLTRELKPESRQRLAELWAAGTDFPVLRDRPHKYFWQAVETILREDGALREEGLDAYSVYRIAETHRARNSATSYNDWPEPLSYSSTLSKIRRDCGWFVGAAISGEHYNHIERRFTRRHEQLADSGVYSLDTSHSASSHTKYFNDYISIGPSVEYHRPLGMAWQVDAVSTVMFPLENMAHALDANSSASVNYMIADRWLITGSARHRRLIEESDAGYYGSQKYREDAWQISVSGTARYFIEDRLNISLGISHSQTHYASGYSETDISPAYSRSNYITLGLSYNFIGLMEAPGLIPRSTLPPVEWPF